jgi:hypothetical protein
MKKETLKSIGAVIAGFATLAVLSTIMDSSRKKKSIRRKAHN